MQQKLTVPQPLNKSTDTPTHFFHATYLDFISACSGFSFVYLVQDVATGRLYALKKIRCPFGSEGVQDAMKEAEMYRTFQHENVIKVVVSGPRALRSLPSLAPLFLCIHPSSLLLLLTSHRTLVWYQTKMVARSYTSFCPTTSVETSWTPFRPICCTTPTFQSQTCSGSSEAFAMVSGPFTATACPMCRSVLGNRRKPTRESKYGNHAQACVDKDQSCRLQDQKMAQDCRT